MNTFNSDFFRGKLQGRMEADLQRRDPKPETRIQRETVVVRDERALAQKDAEIKKLKDRIGEDQRISEAVDAYAMSLDHSQEDALYSNYLSAYTENHRFELKKLASEMVAMGYAVPPISESHRETYLTSCALAKETLKFAKILVDSKSPILTEEDTKLMLQRQKSIFDSNKSFLEARNVAASSFYRATDMLALVGPLIVDPPPSH